MERLIQHRIPCHFLHCARQHRRGRRGTTERRRQHGMETLAIDHPYTGHSGHQQKRQQQSAATAVPGRPPSRRGLCVYLQVRSPAPRLGPPQVQTAQEQPQRDPADNAEYVGVRDVVGQEGLDKVFQVLRAPHTEEPTNWSRRYKANLEKLASGDVIKVAEVVRDLWRRERERGLSAGEKRMLAKARQILVSELALAENTNEDKAEAILDEVLAS